jgi:hypothetical protein
VLRNPEVSAKYMKHYIGVHADFAELQLDDDDPRHATIQRFNPRKWRPVTVFLDAGGKEVARHVGRINSKEEALLLDRFITEKHYLKTDFKTFRAAAQ